VVQAIRIVMEISQGRTLWTEIPFAEHVVLISFDGYGTTVLDGDLQPAGGFAKGTRAIGKSQILGFISMAGHMGYTSTHWVSNDLAMVSSKSVLYHNMSLYSS
jgi:hypothetical protein